MPEREPITDPEQLEITSDLLLGWLEYLLTQPEKYKRYLEKKQGTHGTN